nr:MAG TPA: hypothetical protein [Caudoviricetes sp.]
MILDDFKAFIIENDAFDEDFIKFDFDSTLDSKALVLAVKDSLPCDLARRNDIQVIVKNSDMMQAREDCLDVFDLFCPKDLYQKASFINGKVMHIKALKEPYFMEKETGGRYCYGFNILVTYD